MSCAKSAQSLRIVVIAERYGANPSVVTLRLATVGIPAIVAARSYPRLFA